VLVLTEVVHTFTARTRQDLVVVVATLTSAGVFQPLRRRVQALIDRRFFRSKYDATRTLLAFSARVRDEVDLQQLSADLVAVVDETMQPEHVSLWLPRLDRSQRT
jgi:K+-sensing histidine kinase KdpD